MVIGLQVVFGLFQQWIIPSVKNSLETFSVNFLSKIRFSFSFFFNYIFFFLEVMTFFFGCNQKMEVLAASERLLKLAVPNHLLWLIFFYLLFHSYLNIIGEILKFADRNFYGDWWNASNIEDFWRYWNLPIHRWAVRYSLETSRH